MTLPPGLFVTGTDTGVGKTAVAAAIVRLLVASGRKVGALKPVATGAVRRGDRLVSEDAEALATALGGDVDRAMIAPIVLEGEVCPPVAMRLLGRVLESREVERATGEAIRRWSQTAEVLVVEGVGGLLCPLAEGTTVVDLATRLDYPLVIVARRGLGTLNHTLLTVQAARNRGLRIAAILLNGSEPTGNALAESTNAVELMRQMSDMPTLVEIEHRADPLRLHESVDGVDWIGLARPPRGVAIDLPG